MLVPGSLAECRGQSTGHWTGSPPRGGSRRSYTCWDTDPGSGERSAPGCLPPRRNTLLDIMMTNENAFFSVKIILWPGHWALWSGSSCETFSTSGSSLRHFFLFLRHFSAKICEKNTKITTLIDSILTMLIILLVIDACLVPWIEWTKLLKASD